MVKALLIISCSARKKNLGCTTAWQCYDGITFRILKKIDRESGLPGNLDIAIISAKYGLLLPQDQIEYYDKKMTRTVATRMRPKVLHKLSKLVQQNWYAEVFVNLGKQYLPAIEGLEHLLPGVHVVYATGCIGQKGAAMKRWVMGLHLPSD